MHLPLRSKLIAALLCSGASVLWLSTVVVGMQSTAQPAVRTVEWPTVVVVAHRASAPQATAQSRLLPGKNG